MPVRKVSLRKWRRLKGITNAEMAEKLGISPGQLSKIENGAKIPDPEMMRIIRLETKGAVTLATLVDREYVDRIAEMARERKAC